MLILDVNYQNFLLKSAEPGNNELNWRTNIIHFGLFPDVSHLPVWVWGGSWRRCCPWRLPAGRPSRQPRTSWETRNIKRHVKVTGGLWRTRSHVLNFTAFQSPKTWQMDLTRLSWALCRRSHISTRQCPQRPPATQKNPRQATSNCRQDRPVEAQTELDKPGSHLVDVLQQIQSLFEVVLVGSSVVVADVQLWRGAEETLSDFHYSNINISSSVKGLKVNPRADFSWNLTFFWSFITFFEGSEFGPLRTEKTTFTKESNVIKLRPADVDFRQVSCRSVTTFGFKDPSSRTA